MQSKDEIQLGATYKDMVTGFVGVAISKAEHITGCDTATIEAPYKEGSKTDVYMYDVSRLELVNKKPVLIEQTPKAKVSGGPRTVVDRKR